MGELSTGEFMFASLVAPFFITLAIFAVSTIVWASRAGRKKCPRVKMVAVVAICWVMFFIPTCGAVNMLVDEFRYGNFHYDTAREIHDFYIQVPDSATDISVYKSVSGHCLKAKCDKATIISWLHELKKGGRRFSNGIVEEIVATDYHVYGLKDHFPQEVGALGKEIIKIEGPRASNGAGFTVYCDEKSGWCFILAGYWQDRTSPVSPQQCHRVERGGLEDEFDADVGDDLLARVPEDAENFRARAGVETFTDSFADIEGGQVQQLLRRVALDGAV
jgi:hypothetical protein